MKIKNPKDFWAGLMFSAFGSFFVIAARNYRMGNATSMGPAYFPTVLGGLGPLNRIRGKHELRVDTAHGGPWQKSPRPP